jgi:hypothetical protein
VPDGGVEAAGAATGPTGAGVVEASMGVTSARTPRPTRTPQRKITTDTTTTAMKRKKSCFPFSWISRNVSSLVVVVMRSG